MSRFWPLFISAVVFFVVLATGGAILNLAEQRRVDERLHAIREIGTAQAHLLEDHLHHSLSATFALASILRQRGRIENFDALAAEVIKNYGGISNLQLAPNGVVTQIYPLAGNEAAIGHDLLNDPRRRTEALAAIESRKLTLAGPLALIQGGMAVIGRLPVFVPDESEGERFWGFVIAMIRMPGLLEASKLKRLVGQGYHYELSRVDPSSGAQTVFARSVDADIIKDPVPIQIEVPDGRWTLAIAPREGWTLSSWLAWKIGLVLLVSTLAALPAHHKQYEYGEGELIGTSILDLVPTGSEREQLRNYLAYLVKEQPAPSAYFGQKKTKNGRVIDVQVDWAYKRDGQGQLTGFTSIITDITDHKRADEALREAHDHLESRVYERTRELAATNAALITEIKQREQAEESLRDLSGHLINAHEEGHRRLARELHDDVSQRLAVLAIEAEKLEQQSHYTPELIHGKLQGMKDHIVKLAGDIHRISRQLHPSILDDLGLVDAMESECRRFSELEGIPVKFTADRFPEGTPKDVSLCIYRVTQEGLRNIAKHAKAREAHVTLTSMNGSVLLTVGDSGVGFDPAKTRGKSGLGLASMKERVRLINDL